MFCDLLILFYPVKNSDLCKIGFNFIRQDEELEKEAA